ncbi:MAG TPA: hypothetical protein VMF30_05840 [Pirellulales bacterium]|nr:hypothetical protein [Pirellulales bacterium]
MTDYSYTSSDWLMILGAATLALAWWIIFRMLRPGRPAVEFEPQHIG